MINIQSVSTTHLDPLPIPVGLAVSSSPLVGFSSPSSPLTLGAAATLFFLKVAGTISAGSPIVTSNVNHHAQHKEKLTKFLDEEGDTLVGDEVVSPLPTEDILEESL